MPITEKTSLQRYERGEIESAEDTLVTEFQVALELDGRELIRTTCSPGHLHGWALGYLVSEGHILCTDHIANIQEADGRLTVTLTDSAPREPVPVLPVESDLSASPAWILRIAEDVAARAGIFQATGGTHAMALAVEPGTLTDHEREAFVHEPGFAGFEEDISRTCALEKAIGFALSEGTDFSRCIAFLSSRAPSRMIAKLARCGVPIVAAVSAPTLDAFRLAEKLNVCLCGFVRDERLNVYTHSWRLGL